MRRNPLWHSEVQSGKKMVSQLLSAQMGGLVLKDAGMLAGGAVAHRLFSGIVLANAIKIPGVQSVISALPLNIQSLVPGALLSALSFGLGIAADKLGQPKVGGVLKELAANVGAVNLVIAGTAIGDQAVAMAPATWGLSGIPTLRGVDFTRGPGMRGVDFTPTMGALPSLRGPAMHSAADFGAVPSMHGVDYTAGANISGADFGRRRRRSMHGAADFGSHVHALESDMDNAGEDEETGDHIG